MTKKQENLLIENGFDIRKPELIKHDDGILRDSPHSIKIKEKNKYADVQFDRRKGKFYIIVNKVLLYSNDDIISLQNKLNELTKMINELQKLA